MSRAALFIAAALVATAAPIVSAQAVSITLSPTAFRQASKLHKLAYILEGTSFGASVGLDAVSTMRAVGVPGVKEGNVFLQHHGGPDDGKLSVVKLFAVKSLMGVAPIASTFVAHKLHPDDWHSDAVSIGVGAASTGFYTWLYFHNNAVADAQRALNARGGK